MGVLFSKRNLSESEAAQFEQKYDSIVKNLKSEEIDVKIAELYREYLIDMDMLGLVSLKEVLCNNAASLIYNIKKANISPWMLTGDSYIRAITASYSSSLILKSTPV